MNQLTLNEIKQIEFQILKKFNMFCRENNIRYFLSNGTLLGAIKYKGFIPWDDDVDVLVPREDYERLVSIFKNDEKFHLFSFEYCPDYSYPFAKLCDMSTRKEEQGINNGLDLGIDIDIFPLDFWDNEYDKAQKEVRRINRYMFCLGLTKLRKPDSARPIKRIVKGFAMASVKLLGSNFFIRRIINESNKKNRNISDFCGCKSWCIYGEREIIPTEVFNATVDVEFEGEKFPAPVGYDEYLRCLYGDYKKDPPIDKQKTHHSFVAYKL